MLLQLDQAGCARSNGGPQSQLIIAVSDTPSARRNLDVSGQADSVAVANSLIHSIPKVADVKDEAE